MAVGSLGRRHRRRFLHRLNLGRTGRAELGKLEVRGFIQCKPDPEDRRVKMIALTPAGVKFRAKVLDRLSQPSQSVTCLFLSDKKMVRRIVRQMVETEENARTEAVSVPPIRTRLA